MLSDSSDEDNGETTTAFNYHDLESFQKAQLLNKVCYSATFASFEIHLSRSRLAETDLAGGEERRGSRHSRYQRRPAT